MSGFSLNELKHLIVCPRLLKGKIYHQTCHLGAYLCFILFEHFCKETKMMEDWIETEFGLNFGAGSGIHIHRWKPWIFQCSIGTAGVSGENLIEPIELIKPIGLSCFTHSSVNKLGGNIQAFRFTLNITDGFY